MAEAATKFLVKSEEKKVGPTEWRPFESLRREVDRLFDDFGVGSRCSPFGRGVFDVEPFWRGEVSWGKVPTVDIADTDKTYEITAELPGMDESNIDVKFSDGTLTIKGEKKVSTSRHSSAFDERMIGNLIQLSYLNNSVVRLSINRATIGIAQPRGALRFSSVIASRK